MLQAEKPRVRIPTKSLNFSNLPNPFMSTMALGFTRRLTGMSTRNLLEGGKARPVCKADNLTANCESIA
jgi:hypothetical protein